MAEDNMVVNPTGQTVADSGNGNPNALGGPELLKRLATGSLVDLILDAKCGQLTGIGCLCDPIIRQAAEVIDHRFGDESAAMLYRAICGCAFVPATPQVVDVPVSGVVPASYKPTVTTGTTVPAAAVTPQQPVEPAVSCNPSLPAKGSYSGLK